MINEIVKKQMIEELQPEMKNIDVGSCLELLWKALEYDCEVKELQGIKERYPQAIEKIFNPEATHSKVI